MTYLTQWGPHAARVILGLVFFVFGLNFFIGFLSMPPLPEAAQPFMAGLASSGFVFPLIKTVEVVAGLALLANRFVPLALTLLAPIIVAIAGFHFGVAPSYPMPILLITLELYLAWTHRSAFAPLFESRAQQRERAQTELSVLEGAT